VKEVFIRPLFPLNTGENTASLTEDLANKALTNCEFGELVLLPNTS